MTEDNPQASSALADVGTVVVVDRSTIRALRRGADTDAQAEDTTDPNAAQFDAPKGVKDAKRFAVYDRVEGRYVGAVADDKHDAKAARELVGQHAYAVVGVG